jgi:hypothetical protein
MLLPHPSPSAYPYKVEGYGYLIWKLKLLGDLSTLLHLVRLVTETFEACNCTSRKRVEGIYQNEDCIKEVCVSDALLFAIVLPFSSRVRVCFDRSW